MVFLRAAKFCWVNDTLPAEPQDPQPGLFRGCADVVIACDGQPYTWSFSNRFSICRCTVAGDASTRSNGVLLNDGLQSCTRMKQLGVLHQLCSSYWYQAAYLSWQTQLEPSQE